MRDSQTDGPRVLLVDDDPTCLALVAGQLRRHGFEVHARNTAIGTGALLVKEAFAAVVLDVNMPALRGDQLARLLSKHPGCSEVPIVLWSAIPPAELDLLRSRCGAIAAVSKSSNVGPLIKVLSRLCGWNPVAATG